VTFQSFSFFSVKPLVRFFSQCRSLAPAARASCPLRTGLHVWLAIETARFALARLISRAVMTIAGVPPRGRQTRQTVTQAENFLHEEENSAQRIIPY